MVTITVCNKLKVDESEGSVRYPTSRLILGENCPLALNTSLLVEAPALDNGGIANIPIFDVLEEEIYNVLGPELKLVD